ncbi:MAG TPA: sigma-70 family RNA polymerase sigma factor [Actinobacteria bacterium]|nr:sigma-70 family RNA polymerase sigma factor [Actinomycetota bacterium]
MEIKIPCLTCLPTGTAAGRDGEVMAEADEVLVQRILSGDEDCFEELVNRHFKGLLFLALQMLDNFEEAEEVVQEAFLKAYTSLESYNPNWRFSTWFYRITTNKCLNRLRRKKLRFLWEARELRNQKLKDDFVNSPERTVISTERQERLMRAISKLPSDYRALIIFKYFQELKYEEIAKILNIPPSTVGTKLFRARMLLRKNLPEEI